MAASAKIEGGARRLSIYIGESDRWRGRALYTALLETLKTEGVAGATVLRGVAGFGAHSRIHTAAILRLSEDLPLLIEVIDLPEKIERAVQVISPMIREGLITVEDLQVIKYTQRYLNPLPADRPISEVMTREVRTLHPDTPIAQAWAEMLQHSIKALPVISTDEQVVGMLTDEDLLTRAGLQQRLAVAQRLETGLLKDELESLGQSRLKVADVMSKPAITVRLSDSLGTAAARMAEHGCKRLPVVDETGQLAGVVSRVDILRQVIENLPARPSTHKLPGAARLVGDVMHSRIPIIHQNTDLPGMIAGMVEHNTRRLIVVDADGLPVGLISDADLVSRVTPPERIGVLRALSRRVPPPPSEVTAADLMSPGVLTASPDMEVVEAVRWMLSEKRKWMVVVDERGLPVGLVDRQILFQAVSGR